MVPFLVERVLPALCELVIEICLHGKSYPPTLRGDALSHPEICCGPWKEAPGGFVLDNGHLTSPIVDEMKELSPGLEEPMICSVHPGPVSPDGAASKQAQAFALREKQPTLCHGAIRQRFDLSPLIVASFPQLYLEVNTGHPIQAILFRIPPTPAHWRYSCFLWAASTMC